MTIAFGFIIAAAAVVFAWGALRGGKRPLLWGLLLANTVAAAAGAVLWFVSLSFPEMAAELTDSADLLSWARDAFALWARWGGIGALAAGGASLLAALIRHPYRRVRALVGCAAVWMLLLVNGAYAALCAGTTVDPSPWIRMNGAGLALLCTLWSVPDLWHRLREKPEQKKKKSTTRRNTGR